MTKTTGSYQVPFRKEDGNLIYKPWLRVNYDWRDNFEFDDTLRLTDVRRSGHSVLFCFVSTTDHKEYPMFVSDFARAFLSGVEAGGVIKGRWTFHKRGRYYGVALVDAPDFKEDKAA